MILFSGIKFAVLLYMQRINHRLLKHGAGITGFTETPHGHLFFSGVIMLVGFRPFNIGRGINNLLS